MGASHAPCCGTIHDVLTVKVKSNVRVECDEGHPLKKMTTEQLKKDSGYESGWNCDRCEETKTGESSYHCKQCGWDLCSQCYNELENGDERVLPSEKEPEIIPYIELMRKWKALKPFHLAKLQNRLQLCFDEHDRTLPDISNWSVLDVHKELNREELSPELVGAIQAILPSDEDLDLKDSVFESKNTESVEKQNGERSPMTLFSIPTDLQCGIFNFLELEDLHAVQKVCRSLCIAARNPFAFYEFDECRFVHREQEWIEPSLMEHDTYTSPQSVKLAGDFWCSIWTDCVTKLHCNLRIGLDSEYFDSSLPGSFENLTHCTITGVPYLLSNGKIASYTSLKVLKLQEVTMTPQIIDEIRKFKNLEKLSIIGGTLHGDSIDLKPIVLPALKEFEFALCDEDKHKAVNFTRIVEAILVGSHPETIDSNLRTWFNSGLYLSAHSRSVVSAIQSVKHFILRLSTLVIESEEKNTGGANLIALLDSSKFEQSKVIMNPEVKALCMSRILDKHSEAFQLTLEDKNANGAGWRLLTDTDANTFIQEIRDARFQSLTEMKVDNVMWWDASEHSLSDCLAHAASMFVPWLQLKEEMMKSIGMQKLDIRLSFYRAENQCVEDDGEEDSDANPWAKVTIDKEARDLMAEWEAKIKALDNQIQIEIDDVYQEFSMRIVRSME